MKKFFALLLTLVSPILLHAEYDEYFTKLYILTKDNSGVLHEHVVYCHSFERPDSNFTLEQWKNFIGDYNEPDSIGIFYENLLIYQPIFKDGTYHFGSQYILLDSVHLKMDRVVEIQFLEIHEGFLLDGLYSDLILDDLDWITTPVVDTSFFTVTLNMGNESYFDLIYPTFEILIHERSARVDEILSYLDTLKHAFKMRSDQIELRYGYLNEDCEEYRALVNAYYPMVEQVIALFESEKVVVVYDSGW